MNDIEYKKAKHSDALRISVLLKTVYIQTYDIKGITIESANYITKSFANERIEQLIKENPSHFMVAWYWDNVVGVAEIIFESICPIRKISVVELGKLYVLDRFNGQGIGHGLLKAVEQEVLSKGFSELSLIVYIKNERAIAFYEQQGYKSLGLMDFKMEHNTYKNFVMTKTLA